ncbi:hypothetical protein GUJ93_ZPchr0008g12330 [Zizania palustris]|uniref:Uncharacterized protein n=1 Tax=Zizania palustris TaxID=103762 RepID=A0A8J5QZA0_ZIZPA|nr:hypothetical protein GUJ93_ZPchr0008g12330 [Zizania palustris]
MGRLLQLAWGSAERRKEQQPWPMGRPTQFTRVLGCNASGSPARASVAWPPIYRRRRAASASGERLPPLPPTPLASSLREAKLRKGSQPSSLRGRWYAVSNTRGTGLAEASATRRIVAGAGSKPPASTVARAS